MTDKAVDTKNSTLQYLASLHSSADASVLHRQQEILDLCAKEERTIDDLADHFSMNYYTIYRNVRELVLLNLLNVSSMKREKKHLYRTNWSFIKEGREEIVWKNTAGEFTPVGEYIKRFLKVAPERMQIVMEQTGKILIANWCDKKRGEEGQRNYGEDFTKLMLAELEENITAVKAILYVMEQAVNAPFWEDEEGHLMYTVPVDRETAEEVLHEIWLELNELTP